MHSFHWNIPIVTWPFLATPSSCTSPDQPCQQFTLMTFQPVSSGMFSRLIISCKTHTKTHTKSRLYWFVIMNVISTFCLFLCTVVACQDVCTFVAEPQVNSCFWWTGRQKSILKHSYIVCGYGNETPDSGCGNIVYFSSAYQPIQNKLSMIQLWSPPPTSLALAQISYPIHISVLTLQSSAVIFNEVIHR